MKVTKIILFFLSILSLNGCASCKNGTSTPPVDESEKKSVTETLFIAPNGFNVLESDYFKDRRIKKVSSNQIIQVIVEFRDSRNNVRSFTFNGFQSSEAFNDLTMKGTWKLFANQRDGLLSISIEWERTY